MSRIGKKPVTIPEKVKVTIDNNVLLAKGPLGELSCKIPEVISYKIENNQIFFNCENIDDKKSRSLWGLTRTLVANTIQGVMTGFKKVLQIEGTGYKAEMKGNNLLLSLGYSHPIMIIPPNGIKISSPNPTTIEVFGIDKQLVGNVSAKIRSQRPPEPYKGKGIRYEGEYIRRKEGKKAAK